MDEYIKNRDGDPSLRHSAKAIPEPASETAYRKLRLAYTPHWYAFYSGAMKRYEDMVAG